MSNRAEVAAHFQRQSSQRFFGFDSVITHEFFELKVKVGGSKAA